MKVLLSLSVLYITLALCQAACFRAQSKAEIKNGVLVTQDSCNDPFDGSEHPRGSAWNTDHCYRCACIGEEMECCTRYGGVVFPPKGCKAIINPETCKYDTYRIDNPSELCQ